MITIARRYRFSASHRLNTPALSDEENQRIYGKCNNPYGHGHDYEMDIAVSGEINATTGLVVKISTLDRLVRDKVLADMSHRNLNLDVAEFAALVPTTENLAKVITERLQANWGEYFPFSFVRLSRVTILETERNSFEIVVPKEELPPIPWYLRNAAGAENKESVIVNG